MEKTCEVCRRTKVISEDKYTLCYVCKHIYDTKKRFIM